MPIEPRSDKGYLVPDNPSPVDFEYRLIKIPTDPQWRETYSYLVGLLTFGYVWDKDSGDYEAATATAMDILNCFIGIGLDCMTVCEIVADCIETDIATQAAIASAISSNSAIQSAISNYLSNTNQNGGSGNPTQPISQTNREENLVPVGALCTDANKFAMALSIVQRLNTYSEDFFQQVETLTNTAEYAVTLADNAGIFGSVPASALEPAAWLQDTIEENYTSAYTAATEEALACAVYCAFDGCSISFEQIYDAYQDALNVTLPDVDALDQIINYLVGLGAAVDLQVVGQMHLLVLSLLRWGSSWVELGSWDYFKLIVGAEAQNEIPVPVSCQCVQVWCHEWTGSQIQDDWTLEFIEGSFSARGAEFEICDIGTQDNMTAAVVLALSNVEITAIEQETVWDVALTGAIGFPVSFNEISPNGIIQRWTKGDLGNPAVFPFTDTRVWNGTRIIDTSFRVSAASDAITPDPAYTGAITRIRVSGTGVKPTFVGGTGC